MMQTSTRVRPAVLTVLGLLGTACLLRYSSAMGFLPGAFSTTAVRPGHWVWVPDRASAPVMEGGKLANQVYVEGETNLWGRPMSDDDKANMMKADQLRKDFDERNGKKTWFGPMADKEGSQESRDEGMSGSYINRAGLFGAQDDMRAKAAATRAAFMARNGQEEWYDVTQGMRVEEMLERGIAPGAPSTAAVAAAPALTDNQKAAYPK